MDIVVFGATGSVGKHVLDEALAKGHSVKAFARNPAAIQRTHERLQVVQGNGLDAAAVERAVAGTQGAVSTLGVAKGAGPHDLSTIVGNVIAAMTKVGCRRLVYLSAFGAGDSAPKAGFLFNKIIRPLFMQAAYGEHERAERAISESGLEWVIVRPTRLGDKPPTRHWTIDPPQGSMAALSKADLAAFLVEQLESDAWLRKAPSLFA